MTRRTSLVLIGAGVLAVGAASLARAGYTPDEEYTVFAVRGIAAHGIPLLPSGFLYDRGLLYSYAAWLALAATGVDLPAFRALSLAASAGTLALATAVIARRISPAAGLAAAALAGASVPFWAAATSGRFYAPFLLTWLATLALVARTLDTRGHAAPVRPLLALAALAFVSRLTHELAFTLAVMPVMAFALHRAAGLDPSSHPRIGGPDRLRICGLAAAAVVGGLIAAQAVLFLLHVLVPGPGSGGAMIERFFLWQVLNLFERPQGAPLGVVLSAALVACLIAPIAARRILGIATGAGVAVVFAAVGWAAWADGLARLAVREVLASSLAYPLDMFWHLAAANPVMVGVSLGLIGARRCDLGGDWPIRERVAHLGWVGWVLWFGVIDSGITTNYLLLPTTCMMAALGIDLVALGQQARAVRPGRAAQLARAALTGVALLVALDQWSGAGSLGDRLAVARPTIAIDGIESVREDLKPADLVACTDELACLLLVGRVDAWLALDDHVRERFVVRRDGRPVGVYAGTPVVFTPRDLPQPPGPSGLRSELQPSSVAPRVIVVDVFKAYPVGHSAAWLPRAIEADGLGMRTLLETSQARVVEVVATGGRN